MNINIEKYFYDENDNLVYLQNNFFEEWRNYNEQNLETEIYRRNRVNGKKELISMRSYDKNNNLCSIIYPDHRNNTFFDYYENGKLHKTTVGNIETEDKYENGILRSRIERDLVTNKITGMDFFDYDENNNLIYIHSTFDDTETKCAYYPNQTKRSCYVKFYDDHDIPYSEYHTFYQDGRTKNCSLINLKENVIIKDTSCIYYHNNNMRRVITRFRDDKFRIKLFNTNGNPILILNSKNNTEIKFIYNSKNQLIEKISMSYEDNKQISEIIFNLL